MELRRGGGPKMSRVGFLGTEAREQMDGVGRVLSELGYVEGKNVIYEFRAGRGDRAQRYADSAAELVRLKVDVIVAGGAGAVKAAKMRTRNDSCRDGDL